MKKIIISSCLFILWVFFPKNILADFNPSTAPVTEYGSVLIHGQTLNDLWDNQSNHPPTDGSAKTWSFYPDGRQIVTKGDSYWTISPGQTSWISGSLKSKWASCSNFPASGIDAYSIKPSTGDEYAFSGVYLFSLNSSGRCTINGQDWRTVWSTQSLSPSGNYPFKNHDHLDQFQWLNDNMQVMTTGNLIWILGSDTTPACSTPGAPWHFCEPETLENRWVADEKMENHPPTDKFGLFAVSYNPYYEINTYNNYVWTLGQNNVWDTFRSGFDGYGAREPFLMKDNNKYYLYYDAIDINKNWTTAVAVADHPKGPWQKLGPVQFTGTVRPWEKGCSCASSVFKVGNSYYDFYLGAPIVWDNRYMVPGIPPNGGYYRLGLAVSDSPTGPFRRLRGDGSLSDSTASDSPLLSAPPSGWHANTTGSAQGTLLQYNNQWYYSFPTASPVLTEFGIGLAKAVNNNILGPWEETANPLIPLTAQSENSGIFFDQISGYYLMFANMVFSNGNQIWKQYWPGCDGGVGGGVGLIMYWTKDLFNWDWQTNHRIIAQTQPGVCPLGDSNYVPGTSVQHRGTVGLGFPVYLSEENKLYVAFDGSDFSYAQGDINHMFRNIFLLSIDLPNISSLAGDLNHDGVVNIQDYNQLVSDFGKTGTPGWIASDINSDGKVDIFDYNILVGNWGKTQ